MQFKITKLSTHNLILLFLVLLSIVLFVFRSVQLNKKEIWFSNMNMDSTVLVESLMVNSGREAPLMTHPALGTFILYSKFIKSFDILNILTISEFNQLEASNDPLMLLPDIFYKGRTISIIIAIFSALIFGFIFLVLTQKLLFFSISTILFLSSGGLLFQSLILRSELTSVFFVLLSALLLIMHSKSNKPSFLTVFTAGLLFGFAMLTKIHVMPIFVFIIILLSYVVFKKLKNYPEGFLKYRIIHFFIVVIVLSLYFHFLNLIYHVYSDAPIPVLLYIFISVITLSTITSMLIWFKKRRISSLLNHMNLFSIGVLISFLAVFYIANITTDNLMRDAFNLVFHSGNQARITQELLHSMNKGVSAVFVGFLRFLRYYLLESYLLIFLVLFFILTIKRFNYKASVTFVFGVGYCIFSSFRHFGPHYLIYSDIFFNATLVLLLIRFLSPRSKDNKYKALLIKSSMKFISVMLMLTLLWQSQSSYVKKEYPAFGANSRNLIDDIPFSHKKNKEYSEMMIRKYKNEVNVIERVFNDPYLNGSKDGIDITKKVNYKILGWLALPQARDIKFKVDYQDIIYKKNLDLLKNIYQDDKDKFDEIKTRILNKALGWSDEDVERRIIREIPNYFVNLRMNNKIEFVGYDLTSVIQSKSEHVENEEKIKLNELKSESKEKNEITKDALSLIPGEEFELISYWKCLEEMNFRYSIWATLDKGFDSAKSEYQLVYVFKYPTHKWKPGEIIKEIRQLRVPKYYDPGVYEVKISLTIFNEKKEITPFANVGKIKIITPKKTQ